MKHFLKVTFLMIMSILSSQEARSISPKKAYLPDFDNALGKDDTYFSKYYKMRMGLRGQLLTFYRSLYERNKVTEYTEAKYRIPRIIHQIWIGSPLPQEYKAWQKTWKQWPGWEYKLWTDKDVEKFNFANRDLYDDAKTYGQRADILRMEILNQFGGLYVDMDFECIKPEVFAVLNKHYDFYVGLHPMDSTLVGPNNAIIGAVPGHPILKAYIKGLRSRWKTPTTLLHQEVVLKTGPGFLGSLFLKHANKEGYKDIAFPATFFYPLGCYQQSRAFRKLTEDEIKQKVCRQESAAIHWWETGWKKPVKK